MDVEIEAIDSWPPDFREAAIQGKSLIVSYHQERSRIERCGAGDVLLQRNPPENRYKQAYRALVEQLEALLAPHRIVAYHCSRLTKEETVNIKQEGLRVLTTDLVNKKLGQCLSDGYLKQAEYERMRNSPNLSECLNNQHGSRTGIIHCCANRSTLRDCDDVYRLFRSWGGEALYWGHEQDASLAHVLGRIGVPCIVVCAMPFTRIRPGFRELSEHFLLSLVSDELGLTCLSSAVNIRTEENLRSSDILGIIDYSDPRFEKLTTESSWPSHCQINAPVSG